MPELLEKQAVLTRLQEDIRRALEKPAAERHWAMVIDLGKCIGCRYCITACPYGARTFDFGKTYTAGTPNGSQVLLGQAEAGAYERTGTFKLAGEEVLLSSTPGHHR